MDAFSRGVRKKTRFAWLRNIGGRTGSESSEEESDPRQHAGVCPPVSVGDGDNSASGSQAPPLPHVCWQGNDKGTKGLCGQNPHQKTGNPSVGEYVGYSCQKWEEEERTGA